MPGHRKRMQFKQTDAFTRGMVIGLKRAGWNAGATRVTSARVDRRILRQAVAAPQATCTAILQHVQDTLDHSISTRTISRRLVANRLHSCRPLRRLPLTPPNRRQRFEWCRARSTWMTEWHRVVFSDESRFCLSSDSRRVRVWRRRGERSNPAAIVERPTVRQRGIMVWGAIAYDSRSPLFRIQGTMTAQRYVDDVLRPVTLPYLQGVPNALYQQDNARPHTARISQQALQDVQMLPWPPYSPDLSPIEHVWDIIGRRLHALPQPRSEDEMWQMVEREWRAIPQDAIRTLIDSLPRRVAACIAVRGIGMVTFKDPNSVIIAIKRFNNKVIGGRKFVVKEYPFIPKDWNITNKVTTKIPKAGLENLTNTCYMNSILQCIQQTPILATFLQSFEKIDGKLIPEFHNLHHQLLKQTDGIVNPMIFKAKLGSLDNMFNNYYQHDAHEFLISLLQLLHNDLNRVKTPPKDLEEIPEDQPAEKLSEAHWQRHLKSDDSVINDIFFGQTQDTIECTQCSTQTFSFQPMLTLTTPLAKGDDTVTLEQCLETLRTPDRISYRCSTCKETVEAKKWTCFSRLPEILIIHLSRFTPSGRKNHMDVLSPEELDIRMGTSDFCPGAKMVETRSGKMQDPAQERIMPEESAKPQPGATIGRDASSDPVVLNPNIDIPKFDGTEDPRPWIESLEEIGFLYHWADYIISHKFHQLGKFQEPPIQDFASDANKEEMKMRLNRMQQWNEPAIRFAEDILVLCNKVDPQMEEETKINWVIGGLKKEYSFALHLNPPKNTNELLEICKKLDLFEKNYQERAEKSKALYNGPRSPRPHHQEQWKNATSFRRPYQNTSKPQAPAPRYYQNTSKPQAPTPRYYQNKPLPQVSAPRRSYTPNPEPKPVYPSKTYNKNPNSNRNRTEDGRPICFKCNKPGHVARYCRVRFVRIVEEDPIVTQDKVEEEIRMDNGTQKSRPLLYADVSNSLYSSIPTRNRYAALEDLN
ncbi:USP2 [Cordylochernes scorpioides]|uniref:ubiquitinyl hydrolase 1 n=1 Tax=Cordylochernes scorpioides TaxID=51811 RepID=A0ABY6KXZ3_9ARAC|nr:USP2 [Cordylochernes scorpioides]